jgi:hypothetical protein
MPYCKKSVCNCNSFILDIALIIKSGNGIWTFKCFICIILIKWCVNLNCKNFDFNRTDSFWFHIVTHLKTFASIVDFTTATTICMQLTVSSFLFYYYKQRISWDSLLNLNARLKNGTYYGNANFVRKTFPIRIEDF